MYCVGYKIQTVYEVSPAVAMVIGVVNLIPTVGVVVTVGGRVGGRVGGTVGGTVGGIVGEGVMVEGVT